MLSRRLACNTPVMQASEYRFWKVCAAKSTTNMCSISEVQFCVSGAWVSLAGRPRANLSTGSVYAGGASQSSFDKMFDGIAETANSTNWFSISNGDIIFTVDFNMPAIVTGVRIAPQGNTGLAYHTPSAITIWHSANNADWIKTPSEYLSIPYGYPTWNAGTFKEFPTGL